jgi:5-oxoprolinase (ATP-hydrolysing) subunit A
MDRIDINCDMGGSFGPYKMGMDEEVIRLISSANVGCGFHGGDPHVMRKTVAMAKENGVGIGAHPGLPDLLGFGRRHMDVTPQELEDFFVYQIGALKAFCDAAGVKLQHVKSHGVLSGLAEKDEKVAEAICRAISMIDKEILLLTYSGTKTRPVAESMGLRVVEECFADRAYNRELLLVSRKAAGAVITDVSEIQKRIVQLVKEGTITTIDGEVMDMTCDSICVHGDSPGALEMVRQIRSALEENGVEVTPLSAFAG